MPSPSNKLVRRAWPAALWALVVALLMAHGAWLLAGNRLAPETDILAMLPVEERDPVLQKAVSHIAETAQQRLVVLVGAPDWRQAQQAADAYRKVLASHPEQFRLADRLPANVEQGVLDQFWPYRQALLTPAQRRALTDEPAAYWVNAAQSQMVAPFGSVRIGAWQDDPFGLFASWAQARGQETSVRPSDGRLRVDAGDVHYAVLPIDLVSQSFSLSAQQAVMPLLHEATQAARSAVPNAEILSAGVILHAAAAGEQASSEMSTIGWGSLIGILLLMWLAFRSLKPILLVVLSIGIGCLGALSVSWLLFDRIHLLTLVFGASLIGVAEDYGIHYFCTRLDRSQSPDPFEVMKKLLPGLTLALLTTVVAYLGLALTPFPGLRQMAVFSAVGLIFAWLTVACWFPLLDRSPVHGTRLVEWFGRSRSVWPQLARNKASAGILLVAAVFIAFGIARLKSNDDIRLLQNSPQTLLDEQVKVGKLLATPSLAQFYLVRGETQEILLRREEALKERLHGLVASGTLASYQAMSDWVPSNQDQLANHELVTAKLFAPGTALPQLAKALDEDETWVERVRVRQSPPAAPLTPEAFLATPAGNALRHLWLGPVEGGYASVVALRGVERGNLQALASAAQDLPGVQWVDKVDEISSLLGRYRHFMGWIVLASYVAILLLLLPRYRYDAWRVVAPTAVASALTIAAFGLMGQPLNLFHMLALLLTLGMGVDYGIFLQEHPDRQDTTAWFAVGLSAASTLLSFGLLGLSQTPALQAFGMTMLLGVGTVCLIAPCFRADK
jgi:predicted exporter